MTSEIIFCIAANHHFGVTACQLFSFPLASLPLSCDPNSHNLKATAHRTLIFSHRKTWPVMQISNVTNAQGTAHSHHQITQPQAPRSHNNGDFLIPPRTRQERLPCLNFTGTSLLSFRIHARWMINNPLSSSGQSRPGLRPMVGKMSISPERTCIPGLFFSVSFCFPASSVQNKRCQPRSASRWLNSVDHTPRAGVRVHRKGTADHGLCEIINGIFYHELACHQYCSPRPQTGIGRKEDIPTAWLRVVGAIATVGNTFLRADIPSERCKL
ncbi:hypothetical protein CC78DRAFT_301208 [Lojkania enalia]|uniref:Uncharacterized protein n=1 Tax=Lojkania enalia TaxID=147567 RepID=A0A9P4N1V6_9PLEO|nr:hypothetical protein CC78DRAFT_301208 [Didymosphaeria enalia]